MASISPQRPSHMPNASNPSTVPSLRPPHPPYEEEEEEEDDDDYTPALPPDLAASRSTGTGPGSTAGPSRRVLGPSLGPQRQEEEESEDEAIGPAPPPAGVTLDPRDGIREFMEKEEQRRKHIEEAAKPKPLKREEWMLKPPTSSDLLSSESLPRFFLSASGSYEIKQAPTILALDRARATRRFLAVDRDARGAQQRVADEVMGKKRRVENAEDVADENEDDARKRRKRDAEMRREVEAHT
ncbi:hypothetical protein EW146_g9640, partial [Bondarzewia mesenterica]